VKSYAGLAHRFTAAPAPLISAMTALQTEHVES
jgi:hypothetical protein